MEASVFTKSVQKKTQKTPTNHKQIEEYTNSECTNPAEKKHSKNIKNNSKKLLKKFDIVYPFHVCLDIIFHFVFWYVFWIRW